MKYIFFYCLLSVLKAQEIFRLNRRVIDVFFKNKNFLCVVHNNDLNNMGIIEGLEARNIKTYKNIDVIEASKRIECGHSIIIARDENVLDSMLVKKRKQFLFRVHSTILIFFRGTSEIHMEKYQKLAIERNIEVILVQGLGLKSLFPPRHINAQLRIYSAMRNELLMNCSSLTISCFTNFTYVRTKWTPLFMLTRLKKEFRIAFSVNPPFIIRKGDRLLGVDIELVKLLTEGWPTHFKLLRKDVHRRTSYIHGHPVYYLNSTEADMVIGRSKFIGEKVATYPFTSQCNTFVVHRGQLYPEATFPFQFFQASLWLVFILIIIFMAILIKLSSGIYGQQYSMVYSLVLVIGYVSSYGVPPFPPSRKTFMRFVSLWWCFISLIITTYFSAGLTSSLRLPRIYGVTSTCEEMIQNGFKWLDISDEAMKIMNYSGGSLQKFADSFELEKNSKAISEKLRTRKYGLRVEKFKTRVLNIIGGLDEYGRENMKILADCFAVQPVQYEITYNSAVSEFLNTKILHIVEAGFVDYVLGDVPDDADRTYMEYLFTRKNNRNRLFTLGKLTGVFILLGSGCFLGLLGLFFEFLVYQTKERKGKRRMRGNLPKKKRLKK